MTDRQGYDISSGRLLICLQCYPQTTHLNSWKAVTSTYHLIIKFLTDYGVGELRGNQVAAHKCYVAMMEMDDHLQA